MRFNPHRCGRSVTATKVRRNKNKSGTNFSHRDLENPGITDGHANRDFGKFPLQVWGKARRKSGLNASDRESKRHTKRKEGEKKGGNVQAKLHVFAKCLH